MTGCVLAATGKEFDVDSFLQSSEWQGSASVFRRGEKTSSIKHPYNVYSGISIDITHPDDENIESQIEGAIAYITKHSSELQRLHTFPGVEDIDLNMGSFWYSDTVCKIVTLPPTLLLLAGQHHIEITIAVYATADEHTHRSPRQIPNVIDNA